MYYGTAEEPQSQPEGKGDPSEITWMSSDPSIIIVSEKAALQLVELKKAGSVTITATAPDGSQSSLTIEVEPELVAVGTMKNSVEDGDTVKSEVTLLRAELEPGEADLAYLEKIISQVEVELSDSGDGVAQIVEPAYYEISEDGLTAEIKTDLQIIQDQEDTLTFQSTSAGNQEKTVDVDVVKTSEAIDVELDYSAYPGGSDDTARYQVAAKVTNNSAVTKWAGLRILLSEGDNAAIVASYGAAEQGVESLAAGETLTFTWVIDIDQSAYPDGGDHDVVITAGFGSLLIVNQMLSIAVEAANGQSNELDLSDVWSFHNFGHGENEKHTLGSQDANALIQGLTPSDRAEIDESLREGGAHCFGMSLSVILSKMNILDISQYADVDCLYDSEQTDEIKELLCYYQVLYALDAYQSESQKYENMSTAEQLAELVEKVRQVESGGTPVMFGYGCKNVGDHAVVAYALEAGAWTYNGTTYTTRIKIYDSYSTNFNFENEAYYLYLNKGTDEWIIPGEEGDDHWNIMRSTNSDAYLSIACNDLSILNLQNYDAGLYNYIAELCIQSNTALSLKNSGDQQYTIIGNSGTITGSSDLSIRYDPSFFWNGDDPGALHVVLPDENDAYTVSTLSGEAEELDFYISDEDLFLSVEAAAATGAAFSLDRTLALHDNTGDYELKIADDTAPEGEFNTYTFSGANAGNLSIASAEEGILVTGDDLTNVSVSGTDGESTSELTFSSDEGSVLVENEDDVLVVYEDSNNDGIYETVIAAGEPAGNDANGGGSHSGSGGSSSGATGEDAADNSDTGDDTVTVANFADVTNDAWYADAVAYVYENGLMNGTSATTFSPDEMTTRAMIVTILHRLEGEPWVNYLLPFTDVTAEQWYTEAVRWAASEGIVTGVSETSFAPDDPVTREQLAAILYRYAQYKGYDVTDTADLSTYADASQISAYATTAMQWANAGGLITGSTSTTLNPQGNATRAEVAAILMRFCENIAK